MLTIKDNRSTNERRLSSIPVGTFFMFHDVLCRRVAMHDGLWPYDGLPVIEMPNGIISELAGDAWVEVLRDEQVDISIEDWG